MQVATAKLESGPGPSDPAVPGWFRALCVLWISALWWMAGSDLIARTARDVPQGLPQAAVVFGIALSLGARLLITTLETGFYVCWWRVRSRDLAFGATWLALFALSLLDLAAFRLTWIAHDLGGAWQDWAPWVAGVRDLLPPDLPGGAGLRNALGGIGMVAMLRVLATAWVQARGARAGFGAALAITAAAWAACRLVAWWSVDLLKGMSPVAGM